MLSLIVAIVTVAMMATTAFASSVNPFSLFGDDDREPADSTSGSNYSICKIKITYPNSIKYGTGFLVNSKKVVTAGHVLHSQKDGDATKLELYFGCSGTNSNPYKKVTVPVTCTSQNTYYPSNWKNYNSSYDYGVIKLDNAVSGPKSYFTLSTISSPSNATISIIGYEHHSYDTKFSNWELIKGTGKIIGSNDYRLFTRIDAMPGQSGAPVIEENTGKVVGIYVASANAGTILEDTSTDYNRITRITSAVKSDIMNF